MYFPYEDSGKCLSLKHRKERGGEERETKTGQKDRVSLVKGEGTHSYCCNAV